MSNPFFWVFRSFMVPTEHLVAALLRSPLFHRGVRRIHRAVEERKYGRDPHSPLRQGEATAQPDGDPSAGGGFFRYFTEEVRNQLRGTPTDVPALKKRVGK